jgi:uncharacterized protein YeaO (DUF488 family)
MIRLKRVYEPAEAADGARFLVERLWPRGLRKDQLRMKAWLKDAAPTSELRKWFAHDPAKWAGFQKKYRAELKDRPEGWRPILEAAGRGPVTLLFSSHDLEHNNAVVLKKFLAAKLTRVAK